MSRAERPLTRPGYRWVVCALLFAATTANYADRQILALLKPALDHDLHWSNQQYGAVNAAFQVAYAFGSLAFGWLMDRIGPKRGFIVSAFCSSLAAFFHATATSVTGFAAARFSLGLGSGGNFPGAVKAVTTWFAPDERAFATSVFNSGSNIAATVTPVIVPLLVLSLGWRSTFVVAGVVGLAWILLWALLYRDAPAVLASPAAGSGSHAAAGANDAGGAERSLTWLELLKRRETWAFVIPKFMTDPVWGLLLIWLPDFFKKTHNRGLAESWPQLAAIYSIVTVASLAGGWLPEYLTRSGWSVTRARRLTLLASALLALPIIGAGFTGLWGAVVLIGIAGAAHQSWSANLFSVASDLFPARAVASVVGLGGLLSALGVSLFSVLSGTVLDHYQARGEVAHGYRLLFASFALTYGLGLTVHCLILRDRGGKRTAARGQ